MRQKKSLVELVTDDYVQAMEGDTTSIAARLAVFNLLPKGVDRKDPRVQKILADIRASMAKQGLL